MMRRFWSGRVRWDVADRYSDANLHLANELLLGNLLMPRPLLRGPAVIDDLMIALDQLGWKLVPQCGGDGRWPMATPHPLTPDWCEPPPTTAVTINGHD